MSSPVCDYCGEDPWFITSIGGEIRSTCLSCAQDFALDTGNETLTEILEGLTSPLYRTTVKIEV